MNKLQYKTIIWLLLFIAWIVQSVWKKESYTFSDAIIYSAICYGFACLFAYWDCDEDKNEKR